MKRNILIVVLLCLALALTGCRERKVKFTIGLSANPTEGGRVYGGGKIERDTSVTVKAEANEGYNFKNWTEDDEVVSTETDYKFLVTKDRDLVANFTKSQTPAGYNPHDYRKLVDFLEIIGDDGETNGAKISVNYDPQDPTTWTKIEWTAEDEKRVKEIDLYHEDLCGCLDVSGCSALEGLYSSGNKLNEVNVNGCYEIVQLQCYHCQLTKIDVGGCIALLELICDHNQITELDLSACVALEALVCHHNPISELNLSGCSELGVLDCYGSNLDNLNLDGCTALRFLKCYDNNLDELDVSSCPALVHLDCHGNNLAELDVSSCQDLDTLYCRYNRLTFSTLPLLDIAVYDYGPQKDLIIGTDGEVAVGERIDLSAEAKIEGVTTEFIWYGRDGQSDFLQISLTPEEEGVYIFNEDLIGKTLYCEMTNTEFVGLTLSTIEVKCVESVED